MSQVLTGKPSVDKPWMQYYPEQLIKNLKVPSSTIGEYLAAACPGKDVTAIHYYGKDITWAQIETEVNRVAKALKAIGFGVGDQIPLLACLINTFSSLSSSKVISLVAVFSAA